VLELEIHWEQFELGEKHHLDLFKPVPATEMLPDWFKRLDVESPPPMRGTTAKTCRGLYDSMASGYIFRWPFDVKIEKDEDGRLFCYKARTMEASDFAPHPHVQMDGYQDPILESQRDGVQKLKSPYRFKTPPGTSILVKQPAYRPELRTEAMEGIIDTDTFYGRFNILFMIKKTDSNRTINIKAGTPLAQIIPFVRGEWALKYGEIDKKQETIFEDMAGNIDKFYQRYQWDRKVFKNEAS
jgi:hypothetical protein